MVFSAVYKRTFICHRQNPNKNLEGNPLIETFTPFFLAYKFTVKKSRFADNGIDENV